MSNRTIVWFRRDLRLSDHAPLDRAARRGIVIPVFVLDRALLHHPETAPARVAFMLECLRSLDRDLRDRGGRLILRCGDPVEVLPQLIRDMQADANATSGLSPHIKFGVISLRECYQAAQTLKALPDERIQRSRRQFVSRLRWNSGFAQRFRYIPQMEIRSLYRHFDEEGFAFDETLYQAWQQGQTGFPIVDAAARCLLATGGWQAFNFRTRACYASFLSNLLGMDWRYGALHFMRHLIDGDCPIDHYQWAMQAGITSAIDKSWTRIYNPGQAAVDRFDPQGQFIKRWIPELRHLRPDQLGSPPATKGYPAPILDYKQARSQRVEQLQRQRQLFTQQADIVPYFAPLPASFVPVGSDRVSCDVSWATGADRSTAIDRELFPAAIDLSELDAAQAAILRSWFTAPTASLIDRARPQEAETMQLPLL